MKLKIQTIFVLCFFILPSLSFAKNAGTTTTTLLLEPLTARAAALGEAFSAVSNDIGAFGYNPAILPTLRQNQVSFLYHSGIFDDKRGNVSFGHPFGSSGLGVSLSYYNMGQMTDFDGVNEKSVTARRDILGMVGWGTTIRGISFGASGKYIKSELAQTVRASAVAMDIGCQMPIHQFAIGAAVQNMGSSLRYQNEKTPLPQTVRGGATWNITNKIPTTLYFDLPYLLKEQLWEPGMGVEVGVGPLQLRGGYKKGNDLGKLTFGAGFLVGGLQLDYSYGLINQLDSVHQMSVQMRFGQNDKSELAIQVPSDKSHISWPASDDSGQKNGQKPVQP